MQILKPSIRPLFVSFFINLQLVAPFSLLAINHYNPLPPSPVNIPSLPLKYLQPDNRGIIQRMPPAN